MVWHHSVTATDGAEQRRLRKQYQELFDFVRDVLNRHDPVGIGYTPDEYEPEVGTILPRLREAADVDALQRIVHEEFCVWFSSGSGSREVQIANGESTAGPLSRYRGIAEEIWSRVKGAS
jgi:hypothetical protein